MTDEFAVLFVGRCLSYIAALTARRPSLGKFVCVFFHSVLTRSSLIEKKNGISLSSWAISLVFKLSNVAPTESSRLEFNNKDKKQPLKHMDELTKKS